MLTYHSILRNFEAKNHPIKEGEFIYYKTIIYKIEHHKLYYVV